MNHGPNDESPADRAGVGSPEYRTRLLTKLNCLIAVIEVAIAKVTRSLEAPGANAERLTRIRSNLDNTLAICKRAKSTLQRSAASPPSSVRKDVASRARMSYRDYVELSSIDEYRKFKSLPPIRPDDIKDSNIDELLRRLADS